MQVLYDLSVRLSMHYGGFSSGVTTALGALSRLQGQMTAAGATSAKLNRSLGLLAAGMALTGAGLAGVGVMRGWVTAAGTMQEALAQVGIVAKGTQGQLANLVNQSYTVANQTQFSAPQVLRAETIMGGLNFRDPMGKQTPRQVIGGAITDFMRAAEVAQHFQNTNYEASVKALSQMSHMMGTYSGPVLAKNVALEMGASLASGMSLPEQATALRYLAPAMKTMNLTSQDALALVAVAHQTGLTQGKGASNLGAMLRGLALTGAPKHDKNLGDMEQLAGGNFYNASGQFVGLPETMRLLNRFYERQNTVFRGVRITPEMVGQIARNALLVQGSQAAAVLGSDTSLRQFNATRAQIGGDTPAWLKGVQNTLNMTLQGQLATLKGNLGSISALLGGPLMGPLGVAVHGFVELTGWVVTLLKTHPQMASFIATFTAAATGAALIAGPILVAAGAFGLLSLALVPLGIELLPVIAVIVGIVAAVTAAVIVFDHWGAIVRVLNNPLSAMTGHMGGVAQALSLLFAPLIGLIEGFRLLWEWGGHLITWAGGFSGIAKSVGGAFSVMGTYVSPLLQMFSALLALGGHLAQWAGSLPGVAGAIAGALQVAFAPLHVAIEALKVLHGFWDWLTSAGTQNHGGVSATTAPAAAARATIPIIARQAHRYTQTHGWETAQQGMWQYQQLVPGKGVTWGNDGRLPAAHPALAALHHPAVSHPVAHHTPAPPLIPHKSGGMALIGAGSLHATHQTTEVHHHPVSLTMHINGADHATTEHLATAVAQRVRHEITASARWHNRYHGKGLLNMEPT